VANVFKSGEIVIEYIDGTIGTVGRPPLKFDNPPIGVVCDGTNLVAWTSLDDPPSVVNDLQKVDVPLIRRCDNLAAKLRSELDEHLNEVFAKADQNVAEFEQRMETIQTETEDLISQIPDSSFFICLQLYKAKEFDKAFSQAADDSLLDTFELLSGGGRLAKVLARDRLSNATLIQAVAPLAELLTKDVSLYADLARDVLLAIANNPPAENIQKIYSTVTEIIAGNEAPPDIIHTLKLIQRIAASLRVPFPA
jgi:hypothetical protein